MDNIIQIGNFSVERKRRRCKNDSSGCDHSEMQLEDTDQIVRCLTCKTQIPPYWALFKFTEEYNKYSGELEKFQRQLEHTIEKFNCLNDAYQKSIEKIKNLLNAGIINEAQQEAERILKILASGKF